MTTTCCKGCTRRKQANVTRRMRRDRKQKSR